MTYETLERMVNEHLSAYVDSLGEIPATLRESMPWKRGASGCGLCCCWQPMACCMRM